MTNTERIAELLALDNGAGLGLLYILLLMALTLMIMGIHELYTYGRQKGGEEAGDTTGPVHSPGEKDH